MLILGIETATERVRHDDIPRTHGFDEARHAED